MAKNRFVTSFNLWNLVFDVTILQNKWKRLGLHNKKGVSMRYVIIKQFDENDCGAACIATISKQYGLHTSIAKIREIAGTDIRGTNILGMVKAAEEIGFSAKGVKGTQANFVTDFPLPAIAHVISNGRYHFVVVHKKTKKHVLVADPAKGLHKMTCNDFFRMWTGVLIILVPKRDLSPNKNKGYISRFIYMLSPHKRLLVDIFFFSIFITLFGIASSFYFKLLIDDVITNVLENSLVSISICVIFLYIFKAIFEFLRTKLMLFLSQKIDLSLILGYYQHVLGLPMNFFGSRKIGEIVSRFMDASKIREAISNSALTFMIDSIMLIFGGIILYLQSPFLFFITFAIFIIYMSFALSFNKAMKHANELIMEDSAQLNSYLVESLNGIETVKSFNAERKAQYKTDGLFVKLLKSSFKSSMLYNYQRSILNAIITIGGVLILWGGASNVLNETMTLGTLISYNALMIYFIEPMKNLVNLQPNIQTALVASERLDDIMALDIENTGEDKTKISLVNLKLPIIIKDLDFRYGSRNLVLKNLNMQIDYGEKIAIVGESGSGKTTIAKLIMNFYKWEKGDIFIGKYNIQDIALSTLRKKVVYISQNIFLFSGTIIENLKIGNQDATLEEIMYACSICKADEFINQMPMGYNTYLEENGSNLSGGQKQRLAIARALLNKPDILILDEATSNLDSVTEKGIEATINECSTGITTIIIAHRLSTIKRCDKIFVLSGGTIVEKGSHSELVHNSKGLYYKFWKEQVSDDV